MPTSNQTTFNILRSISMVQMYINKSINKEFVQNFLFFFVNMAAVGLTRSYRHSALFLHTQAHKWAPMYITS